MLGAFWITETGWDDTCLTEGGTCFLPCDRWTWIAQWNIMEFVIYWGHNNLNHSLDSLNAKLQRTRPLFGTFIEIWETHHNMEDCNLDKLTVLESLFRFLNLRRWPCILMRKWVPGCRECWNRTQVSLVYKLWAYHCGHVLELLWLSWKLFPIIGCKWSIWGHHISFLYAKKSIGPIFWVRLLIKLGF